MQYDGITKVLLQRIPVFAEARASDPSFMSYDDDGPYLVYGDFGLFLRRHLATPGRMEDEMLLQQGFDLVGEMLTSTDPEVVNLAQVGVLEPLTDSSEAIPAARRYLTGDALAAFERWLKGIWD